MQQLSQTYELSQEELDKIVKLVTQQTKLSKVIVDTKINPDLIGGFRVKVGTTVFRWSVLEMILSNYKENLEELINYKEE